MKARWVLWTTAAAAVGWPPAAEAQVNMEWVTVGDPCNVDDIHGDGYGGVDYVYRIGKYEVTNGQYREFLNAVAAVGDPYGLYDTMMASLDGGIDRSGSGTALDPYVYTAEAGDSNWDLRPVNYVSSYDCFRFANWLQNGQPTGGQVDGVTEDGTYDFYRYGPYGIMAVRLPDRSAFTEPHVVVPTEDEWYKAAYYKGGSRDAGYWDYPTQSDMVPNNNPPAEDTGNSANYFDFVLGSYAVGPPYFATEVGAYGDSDGPYGTFDQAGNRWEYTEEILGTFPNYMHISRGGCFTSEYWWLSAGTRGWVYADYGCASSGFRLAEIPALSPIPGDANGDGIVDFRDYLAWKCNAGTDSGATREQGDFDGDGDVDREDFLVLREHMGQSSAPGEAIPEPATLSLLALGGLAFMARRRK